MQRTQTSSPSGGPEKSALRPEADGKSRSIRYGLAATAWVAAAALTVLFAPYIARANFVFFWVAILFAAWYAGLVPALVGAAGAVLAVHYFLTPPARTFETPDSSDLFVLAIFVGAATTVSTLTARLERARLAAEQRARELSELNEHLTEQHVELEAQTAELESQTEEAQVLTEELAETNVRLEHVAAEATAAHRDAEEARARTAELLAAERAAMDRARRLLMVTAGLSEASTPHEVADVILHKGLDAIGADAGSLAIVREGLEGTELEVVRSHGYAAEIIEQYQRVPLRGGRPLADALLSRTPQLIESADEWRAKYPEAEPRIAPTDFEAFAAIPVTSQGRAIAAISASFRGRKRFDEATRTFLASLGEQCGLALERARAYEAERQAREFSADILSSIRDAFMALDREYRFIYVNSRAEAMLGRTAAELTGRSMWQVFPGSGESELGRAVHRVLETGIPETVESFSRIVGAWVELRLYPSASGLSLFFQDVTARRRARERADFLVEATRLLSESLEYEATLAAVARAAVPRLGDWCAVDVVRDPDQQAWPPVLERLAVVHQDPAMVAKAMELSTRYPTDWSSDTGIAGVIRTGEPLFLPEVTDAFLVGVARDEHHLQLLRALRISSVIVVPLMTRGLTLGALTLCMADSGRRYDESDLRLAEDLAQRAATAVDNSRLYRDAERARAEAEESNRAKGLFLTTMSHELRTPLNAITGYVDLLEMELRGPITEAQRADLGRVRRSAKTLMALVNDVLNFARIEAAQMDYRLEGVHMDTVLADLEALIAQQIEAKRLHYEYRRCSDTLVARADPDRLRQILTNLLTNAIKFTDAGGRITVSCEPGEDDGVLCLHVSDTGRGIPEEQLERVFEPFVQLDRHLNPDSQQGVGLGLAISRDLARGMGGDLVVTSRPGEGSTFTLILPRARGDHCAPSASG